MSDALDPPEYADCWPKLCPVHLNGGGLVEACAMSAPEGSDGPDFEAESRKLVSNFLHVIAAEPGGELALVEAFARDIYAQGRRDERAEIDRYVENRTGMARMLNDRGATEARQILDWLRARGEKETSG